MISRKKTLQKVLSFQFTIVAIIPLVVAALLIYAYLTPLVDREITARNQRLAEAVRAQTELFLNSPVTQLESLRAILRTDGKIPGSEHGITLNSSVSATSLFEAIYLVGDRGLVLDVGLPASRQALSDNYFGLDVSGRGFIADARRDKKLTWSNTFLSAVSGKVSIGLAVPMDEFVLVGDFSIERLSDFVRQLHTDGEVLPIIIDRMGHLIAHPSSSLAAQQLNVANTTLVKKALQGETGTGRFVFEQTEYIASTARIPELGWTTLVGELEDNAYQELRVALAVVGITIAGAALLAVLVALFRARTLAEPIRVLTEQAGILAGGSFDVSFPQSDIHELATMGDMFTFMANSVQEREERLSVSEREYRQVVENTDNLITRVDREGKLLFVNAAASGVFGLSPEECVGRDAFDFVCPEDRDTTISAFHDWVHGDQDRITFENRQCGQHGQIHHMLWTISTNRGVDDEVIGFNCIARDITERKQAEDEMKNHQRVIEIAAQEEQVLVAISQLSLEAHSIESFLEATLEIICQDLPWLNIEARGAVLLPNSLGVGLRIAAVKGVDRQLLVRLGILSEATDAAELNTPDPDEQFAPYLVPITGGEDEIGQLVLFKRVLENGDQIHEQFFNRVADILSLGVLRRLAESETKYLAYYDTLTGLANRRLLLDRLDKDLIAAARRKYFSAVLFLDLDNFKTLNDALGHSVGDMLLRHVAERLRQRVRGDDTVARLGGDEFVLLISQVSVDRDLASFQALTLAEDVCTILAQPYDLDGHEHHLSASIGIVLFPNEEDSAGDILRHADAAMYGAKSDGRNTARFYQKSMQIAADARLRLGKELRHAIDEQQFELHYHAQVDGTGKITGAEALIRWQHPEKGTVTPDQFIPVAEESGMIIAIGEWVFKEACTQLSSWLANGLDSHIRRLAINVSPWQFRQRVFVEKIISIIDDTGVPPNRLMLEITEGVLVENVDDAREKIAKLKLLGIGFSIDDFGTGYSSLAYLRSLPLDELKVDRSFVQDLLVDANDAAIVDTILAMASRLSLHVTAEGVETNEQLNYLYDRGCQSFQGFLFSPPLSAVDFEALCLKDSHMALHAGSQ